MLYELGLKGEVPGHPQEEIKNVAEGRKLWTVPDRVHEPLYAIVPLTNFWRFKARWKHFLRAINHFSASGAVVYVVEAALHERDHAVDEFSPHKVFAEAYAIKDELAANCRHDDPNRGLHRYIRLRLQEDDGLWQKEALIMAARRHFPMDAKYMCFLDGDISFGRPAWVSECIQLLQEYKVLQMFSSAHDLNSQYEVQSTRPSFISRWQCGETLPQGYYYPGQKSFGAWSGLAWAWRVDTFDQCSGIPDWCIHGGGDWHLAWALIGEGEKSLRHDLHPNYKARLMWHQAQYEKFVRRNVGVMRGSVFHMHHGPKRLRRYSNRHELLAKTQFDPDHDLSRDVGSGLWRLVDDGTDRFLKLRDGMRRYAIERDEDDPNS